MSGWRGSRSSIRAAGDRGRATPVLATGSHGDGLVLVTDAGAARLLLNGRLVSTTPVTGTAGDCATRVAAGPAATVISIGTAGDVRTINLAGELMPKVFAFRTDLDPGQAAGMTLTARPARPFATSPTGVKTLLIAGQLLAALAALRLLARPVADDPACADDQPARTPGRQRWCTGWVDLGVLAVLAGWAIIGPLTDDDGFATTIARNAALTGHVGNYYRWGNAFGDAVPRAVIEAPRRHSGRLPAQHHPHPGLGSVGPVTPHDPGSDPAPGRTQGSVTAGPC